MPHRAMGELPSALVHASRGETLDGLRLDLSPVYHRFPWVWVVGGVPPILAIGAVVPIGVIVAGLLAQIPLSEEVVMVASMGFASVAGTLMVAGSWALAFPAVARQVLGVTLEVRAKQLVVTERRPFGSEQRVLPLADIEAVHVDAFTLVFVMRGEDVRVPIPDRTARTRAALDQFLDRRRALAEGRDGDRDEIPDALRAVSSRAAET